MYGSMPDYNEFEIYHFFFTENRAVGKTNMNERSSRSHCVFKLVGPVFQYSVNQKS